MAEVTARVETAMLNWDLHQVVTVERTDFVELLIDGGRLTPLSYDAEGAVAGPDGPVGEDPAGEALEVDPVELTGSEPAVRSLP